MKTVRILILTLLLLCAALVLTACNVGNGVPGYLLGLTASTTDSAASTTDAAEVKSDEAKIVAAEGFTLDGTTLSVTLPNAVDSLSLPDKIAVSEGATWQVSSDRLGRQIVAEKTLSLAEGDNVFYVFVTAEDGKTVGQYTVNLRRRPIYTVAFDTADGTAVAPLRVEEGGSVSAPATDPTRTGYEFAGWDADFSALVTGNLTVRARWTPNTDTAYTVEYYLENAAGTAYERIATDPMTGTSGSSVTAERKVFPHYVFSGARSTQTGTIAGDGSLLLKMYYQRETYTVAFKGNGGTLKSGLATQSVRYGTAATIPAFTRNGYEFTGWDSTAGLDAVSENLTVTAQWQIVTYTVTYELDGGTNAAENPATYTVENAGALASPTRDEDHFLGWFLPNGQQIRTLTGQYSDLTLTARWSIYDRWELMGLDLSSYDASERNLKIGMSTYGDVEKRSKNDVFLAGPDEIGSGTNAIQQMIYQRNAAANLALGTTVEYSYWSDLGWGQQAGRIKTLVQSWDQNAPNLFVNMIYDLGLATLNGCFQDVRSIPNSFFDFSAEGWLTDWMDTLSLTGDRAYVLGSDYFLDIYRSTTVLPFNTSLMDANGSRLAPALFGGALGQGETTSGRFFDFVEAGNWTWDALGILSEAFWIDSDANAQTSINDSLGIVADANSGLSAAAFLYTADVELTETYVDGSGQRRINYAESAEDLGSVFNAVASVFNRAGTLATTAPTVGSTPSNPGFTYHNVKFSENTLLFAGVRMLGALEEEPFSQMRDRLSVVPLPKVKADDEYKTLVHNVADAGAININTHPQKTRALTAYLQYCAENSVAIRDEFLNRYTKYGTLSYSNGSSRMLDLIYEGIVGSLDKTVEDLMYTSEVKPSRWHAVIKDHGFRWGSADLASSYQSAVTAKQRRLDDLLDTWYTLPKR